MTSYNRATGIITNSFNTGTVTGKSLTGGLVGSNVASSQIINSYSTGAVSSVGLVATGIGGLVGGNSGIIKNSYATGTVTGVTAVGGVVGTNTSAGSIENVYSSGAVSLLPGGSGVLGGVLGSIAAGTSPVITGGYYNTTVNSGMPGVGNNGGPSTPSLTGLTSAQMQNASNFSAFTFTTTTGATGNNWVMVNTDGSLNGAGNATGATGPMLAAEYSTNIYSSHQLQLMAMNLAGNYTLKQDINAAGTGSTGDVWNGATFVPVGTGASSAFSGSLDGAGHTISGLVVNRPASDFAGLFGYVSNGASVRNVGLEGGSITGRDYTGALVGANQGGTVSGNFSTVNVTGNNFVGGLVGNSTGTISNNYASGAVTGADGVGGLLGSNVGSVSNNYSTGQVTGSTNTGGLLGYNFGSGSGNFWDTTTSGRATSATGTGLTTAQMKLLSSYSAPGWNLASTWIVYDTYTYPLLRAFMTPLQVTFAANASKTYDGTNSWTAPGYTYSNPNVSLSGTLSYGAAGSAVNAGTYAITAGGLYSGQHGYAISTNDATLTINKLNVALSGASVASRSYDGTTAAAISGGTLSGVLSQDIANITFNTGIFDNKDAGTGKSVTVIGGGSAGGNYAIVAGPLTGTITPKALTVSGLATTTREYDGTKTAVVTGGTLSGLVGSETLNLGASTGMYDDANAASGKALTVSLGTLGDGTGLASNYTLSTPSGVTGTISAKQLSWINLAVSDKVYDGNNGASITGGSLSGFVGGETLTSASTGSFSDKNAANGKTITVNTTLGNGSGGGLASNYTLANATTTANITPKALTVSGAAAGDKVYDGSTAAVIAGGTLSGLVGSETVNLGALSGTFGDKNAGTNKAVTVTGGSLSDGGNGGLASNYSVGAVTGLSANITQKALTVTGVSVASKSYDGSTKATISGGTLNGLVSGETLSLSGQSGAFNDKDAGNGKAVTVTGATLGNGTGLASNYTVSNATGVTGNITPKALTVDGVTAADKVYDGGLAAVLSGGTLSGMVGSETLGLSSLAGVFGDKNVASGKAVTVTGGALSDGTGGGLASNYTVGAVAGLSASITPKALTVSGVTVSAKAYDGNTKASLTGGTLNGLVAGETVSVSGQMGTFNDKDAGTGKAVTVTGTTLVDGTGLASNYTVTAPTNVTGTITAKTLTWTNLAVANKEYDGNATAAINKGSITGLISGETLAAGPTAAFADKNAGNGKTVTVHTTLGNGSGGGLASNYTLADTSLTANITKATISAVTSIVVDSKVYDGGLNAIVNAAGATFAGMVNGDSLNVSATSANFIDKNAGSGKVVNAGGLSLGGTDAGNYNLTAATGTGTGTISQAQIASVSGITAASKTYDGTDAAILNAGATYNGMFGGDSLTFTATKAAFSDKNAGNGKTVNVSGIALGGADAGNYSLASNTATGTGDIAKASITGVSGFAAGTRVYDATTTATVSNAGATFAGMVNGDSLNVSATSANFIDKNAGSGKAVNAGGLSLGGTDAGNYNLTAVTGTGTGTITQAQIASVSGITAASKTYDGTDAAILNAGATYNGMFGGDSLTFTATKAAFSDKNAGNGKTVNVSGIALGGADAGNYSLASNTATGTGAITPKALTVTGVTADNKVYDGTLAASLTGGALNGLVSGETLSLSGLTGTFATQNVASNIAVTARGAQLADGTGLASNYTVSNPTGVTANITPKALTIGGIAAGNKVYDGTLAASLTGGALQGLVGDETLVLSGTTGMFGDKNAGSNKTVTVSGASLADASGLASNYTVSNPSGLTASITPKTLTVTGQLVGNKVYDGNTAAQLSGGTLSGLVGGESLGLAGQSAVFSDKNAANGKAVTVTGTTLVDTASGLASNYTVSNPSGLTASITAKALTVTGQLVGNKVYDGNAQASLSGGTLNGLVGSETLDIAGQTAVFSDKNAATAKAVTVTGTTLVDTASGLASNYTVSNPTGLTASITAKALTVTGQLAGNKVYDGNTAAQLSGGVLAGLVAGESLGLAGQTATFADKNAATAKAVTVTGTTLVDTSTGLARNYTVSNPTGLTASITPASLLVRATGAAPRVYDTTTNASVTLADNRIAGDVLTISNSGASFADKNAGANKTVTVNGIALGGTDAGNYTVNATATTTASITQAVLGVKVGNAERDQNLVNPPFTASYTGLLGNDTLANEVSGNLVFSTPATVGAPSGSYLVSAAGQTSTNYALTYTPGVLTVKPTEARQGAVASVIGAVNVAPSQGNMVQAEVVAKGETVTSKEGAVQVAAEGGPPRQGSTPVVLTTASVNSNVLPGLRLSVLDTGLRLPVAGGNTSIESQ
ncbi:YDG domain-containing protein [Janthinobacterium sp. TND4EL3]|uniref:YDG domain-containing protein n=1 Tax=Janthinobacterium sp. TND4EL3 TaxID=1907311 RepID=UPI000970941E|nr:YDG domain-containing protein [Janthinobacterium sp. TND4EL3]